MNAIVGTDLGTIASGFISASPISYIDWRWCGYIAAIAFFVSFVLVYFFFEETRYYRGLHPTASSSSSVAPTTGEKTGEKTPTPKATDTELGETHSIPPLKTYKEKIALWSLPPPEYRQSIGSVTKEILTLFYFPAVVWVSLESEFSKSLGSNLSRLVVSMVSMCPGTLVF